MNNKYFGKAEFLTLDPEKYPAFAKLPATFFVPFDRKFVAAQFMKSMKLDGHGAAKIRVFADTKFRLTVNGKVLGVGPVAAGGDYGNTLPMPKQYFNTYETEVDGIFEILCEVQTPGVVQTDYSAGKGGFIFAAEIDLGDRKVEVVSDESWLVRFDPRFDSAVSADLTREMPGWEKASVVPENEIVWNLADPEIPALRESIVNPQSVEKSAGKTRFVFDRIYSAYVQIESDADSDSDLDVIVSEYSSDRVSERIRVGRGKTFYRGFRMWSVGEVTVTHPGNVRVEVSLVFVRYPVDESRTGSFACSDEKLTAIYELGKKTLEICRQSLHLDSPLHQETLGCTGDYAIENLMTSMTFGDMRLSRLDLVRTSDYLRMTDGYMFHTSYSLIFVTMLWDYYMFTADIKTVRELLPTVEILLRRFAGYTSDGVIENPPNYMFIEWGTLDGYNLHHPPKALGQTALNSFYRMALLAAAKLFRETGNDARADEIESLARAHRTACVRCFYEADKNIFSDGTPSPESDYEPGEWLPANAKRRYHTRQANTLAVLSGLTDDAGLMERVILSILGENDEFEDFEVQPYFMHYVMEAARKTRLFGKYGLRLLHLWDKQVIDSPKGMKEGWGKFVGDNSHAWGATPTYQLPMALSGLEITKSGFTEYRLSPGLYGLDWAEISFPTPKGMVRLTLGEK